MALDDAGTSRALLGADATLTSTPDTPIPAQAQRALTFGLLLSALRCTIQYVLLPFVLPWVGITGRIPPWLTLSLALVALAMLIRNIRYLWRLHHARRWSYLVFAGIVAAALMVFMVVDLHSLTRL